MKALTREREHRFFHAVAWLLAGLVFLGFARTYYLKSFFGAPALPLLLHAHGIVDAVVWLVHRSDCARELAAH
ncbi:hypothetical protein [Bryobacter aggregatus]|uniref:hypothetical protein n=1 Tax=Bryobacter aggregatus TaxID=360054 RepID=UPI0012BAFFC6|nr:hypothetical protein [Bryobacter aggregatus]